VLTAAGVAATAPVRPDRTPDEVKRSLELPRTWELGEIADATPPYKTEGKVYVLAWQVREDDRPLRVESCLVLKVLEEPREHGHWSLAHLYRHPFGRDNVWTLPPLWVSPPPPLGPAEPVAIDHMKRFKSRPTNKDIYDSLKDVQWRFDLEPGWRWVGCAVCERNWEAAIDEKPTRFFGKK
jgi:hypothetical protein